MPGPALVVGLGNPGPEYADTRHNVGFRVVELLAARAGGGRFSRHKSNADVLEGRLAGRRVVLAKPRTYMNVSGGPVAGLVRYYGGEFVVVHDDLDLGFGRPPGRQDPVDFVLKRFSATERKDLDFAVDLAADATEALLADGLEPTQNRFHALSG